MYVHHLNSIPFSFKAEHFVRQQHTDTRFFGLLVLLPVKSYYWRRTEFVSLAKLYIFRSKPKILSDKSIETETGRYAVSACLFLLPLHKVITGPEQSSFPWPSHTFSELIIVTRSRNRGRESILSLWRY